MDTPQHFITSNDFEYHQVISVLMNNCAAMRGKKGELEMNAEK